MRKPKSKTTKPKSTKKAKRFSSQSAVILLMLLVLVAGTVWAASYFFMFDRTEALRQAVNGNGAVSCTVTTPGSTEGIRLYANKNGVVFAQRGIEITHDLTAVPDPTHQTTVYILHRDNTEYIWSEGGTQGIKVDISNNQNRISEVAKDRERFKQEMEENEVTCRRGANGDRFNVPEEVDFKTVEELFGLQVSDAAQGEEEDHAHEEGEDDHEH